MQPTLLVGDYILVDKSAYRVGAPQRSDIVVFLYPQDEKRDFIQRIVGTPGETVHVKGRQVFINGELIPEPYVRPTDGASPPGAQPAFCGYAYGCEPTMIPADSYFVMGDNRDNSQDSRYWGFLPRDLVKGKALVIYWSYESGREDYQENGAGATLRGLGSVFVHFFTRTRWDRMLHQIH
jgi:signal peptidase I